MPNQIAKMGASRNKGVRNAAHMYEYAPMLYIILIFRGRLL